MTNSKDKKTKQREHKNEYRKGWFDKKRGCTASDLKDYYLEKMQGIAEGHGGSCLSVRYVHSQSNLLWMCSKGHVWFARPNNVEFSDSWCPTCHLEKKRKNAKVKIKASDRSNLIHFGEMKAVAGEREGKCLAKEYLGSDTNVLWECKHGHQWKAYPSRVKAGTWCPECARGKKTGRKRMEFSREQIREIHHYRKLGCPISKIAKRFGCSPGPIKRILHTEKGNK